MRSNFLKPFGLMVLLFVAAGCNYTEGYIVKNGAVVAEASAPFESIQTFFIDSNKMEYSAGNTLSMRFNFGDGGGPELSPGMHTAKIEFIDKVTKNKTVLISKPFNLVFDYPSGTPGTGDGFAYIYLEICGFPEGPACSADAPQSQTVGQDGKTYKVIPMALAPNPSPAPSASPSAVPSACPPCPCSLNPEAPAAAPAAP